MSRFLVGIMSIIALVSVAKITPAQQIEQTPSQQSANSESVARNSPYRVGTITGIVSGEYGSILFIELADKTKLHGSQGQAPPNFSVLKQQKNKS